MTWTEKFKEEMRERYLLQMKIVLILWTTAVLTLPLIYYLFLQYEIVDLFKYIPIIGIYEFVSIVVFYFFMKRTSWVRLVAYLILIWDTLNMTLLGYLLGVPHFVFVMLYPVIIMIYSISYHPEMAKKIFGSTMLMLGVLIVLTSQEIIPYLPALARNKDYPLIQKLFIESDQAVVGAWAMYFFIVCASLFTLLMINFIVRNLRHREQELIDSNEKISRLGDKLKVYLPHQFVESLARGDRDSQPDYKRKRLTTFFSDVKGFTTWTDELEPEEVREILNQYLSEMSAIADKHGGTVDKFIGDALMIFFGDPDFTSDKDHALRCVRMAMEMQEKMRQLRDDWRDVGYEEPLRIRVGINTGYATVGNFGSDDRLNYTALGSAVNLASRLESACEPDRITISHTTFSLIKNEIECEPKGEIMVKGFADPVKIYEVAGTANTKI